ncbi:hypothetical protein FN846DRAFT_904831 [Sphaerosporella brunnea]|uniref:Uncharacterized protein n=1 Tax=Sphaerosporella brunnea TaxID=1250544 RepID=A0A5J5F371_9PEZI|nr:hypothetical protein FN846DRAFT_904831 [Sphaerosporella brunnea]
MVKGRPGRGNKRQQILRAAREIKRQKSEERLNREEEVVDLPEELLARVGVEEDSELEESDLNTPKTRTLKKRKITLMASSPQFGFDAFEDNTMVFNYQRGAEPSACTQYR